MREVKIAMGYVEEEVTERVNVHPRERLSPLSSDVPELLDGEWETPKELLTHSVDQSIRGAPGRSKRRGHCVGSLRGASGTMAGRGAA